MNDYQKSRLREINMCKADITNLRSDRLLTEKADIVFRKNADSSGTEFYRVTKDRRPERRNGQAYDFTGMLALVGEHPWLKIVVLTNTGTYANFSVSYIDRKDDSSDNEKFVLEFDKKPSLVFVQEGGAFEGFKLYQDGELVEGIRYVNIDAGIDNATTHEVEYLTGYTKKHND